LPDVPGWPDRECLYDAAIHCCPLVWVSRFSYWAYCALTRTPRRQRLVAPGPGPEGHGVFADEDLGACAR
jgi:hypothetical protein